MKKFYQDLYHRLNEITPLVVDCGELCSSACCNQEYGQGVFLFPGEEIMFEGKSSWSPIIQVEGRQALNCEGVCERNERPLFCRIFPLFPYISTEDTVEIIFYSPMSYLCPLIKLKDFSILAEDFLDEMEDIADSLIAQPECLSFLKQISREIDQFETEPWTKL